MRYVQLLCIIAIGFLSACGTLPTPQSLSSVSTAARDQPWRMAVVIVHTATDIVVTPYVIITPENAPQLAEISITLTISAAQRIRIPWRDDHGIRYAPAILTGVLRSDPLRIDSVSEITTALSEASVANMPTNQIVRVIGLLNSHPDSVFLHDRANPRMSRAFRPAWVSGTTPIRLAEGAPIMIEGVRVEDALIPLVIAPVITR
ncbi:MAG: hypothetical protein ACK5C8_04175 [Roseiflexaceae bacterium]|jgi:hypothetical protein|nr:hypothetical protein [Chloroflexaceae bacterium]MCE2852643.1 hypothetical protein [Chloroflexaceae bacterium]